MVMDARNGKSILSQLQDASQRMTRKVGSPAEDVVSLIVAEIWEQTDAPPEVIEYLTEKMVSLSLNSLQQARRGKRRVLQCELMRQSQQVHSARDRIDGEDLKRIRGIAMENCADELDQDLVLMLMQEHPEFESPLQVFQRYGTSNSAGYRRLTLLKEILRLHYSASDLPN